MDSQMVMKKKKNKKKMKFTITNEQGAEDRISSLPDELIHHILWFVDSQSAVKTSILSKRWKLIWTTAPCLNIFQLFYCNSVPQIEFIDSFLSHRNHDSELLKLNIYLSFGQPTILVDKFISYAISHNVQDLTVRIPDLGFDPVKLSNIISTSMKKLTLDLHFCNMLESDCWDLPSLTTLHLSRPLPTRRLTFPKTYLMCLPSLRTLFLVGFELPESISLPYLTTLYLEKCWLPPTVCNFPALTTLTLDDVVFPENISEFFYALFNLQNLTLFFSTIIMADWVIDFPQLINLEINYRMKTITSHSGKIIVLAPKTRNFSSVGFFPITFGFSQLENVDIKRGGITTASMEDLKKYYRRVTHMFSGLGSARIITLDLETIEALSAVSNHFVTRFPSPFYNLKYLKVPQGYKGMPTGLKGYLLGGSPKATIVTTLPQNEFIPQTKPACLTTQKLLPEKPSETLVASAGNDLASSTKEALNFGLWQGHEVNSEFVDLLNCIVKKYPETFDCFTTNSEKLCTMKLNMLCTTVKAFIKISMAEVNTEIILEYRTQFAHLQRSFNIKWLVERLNYIEQLHFSQPLVDKLYAVESRIDDTKSKLRDLQDLRMKIMTEIQRDVGTMGTIPVGYFGDGLFYGT